MGTPPICIGAELGARFELDSAEACIFEDGAGRQRESTSARLEVSTK